MPATIPCAHCGQVGFVRWEHVIQGDEAATEYYCGRCEHEWVIRDHERRHAPRPAKRLPYTEQRSKT